LKESVVKPTLRFSAGALFALTAMLGVDPSRATTLTYNGYSVVNEQNVTITGLNGHTIDGGSSITGGAGEIVLHGTNGIDFDVFCVDIFDWLQNSGTFTYTDNTSYDAKGGTSSPGGLTNAQLGEIGGLIAYYRAHESNGDSDLSAATQVAIWQTEYGTSDYRFSTSAGVAADMTNLLAMDLPADGAWVALVSDPGGVPDNQTQALLAPEPAAFALFASALAFLCLCSLLRRRVANKRL
jgi:hypothetical protein